MESYKYLSLKIFREILKTFIISSSEKMEDGGKLEKQEYIKMTGNTRMKQQNERKNRSVLASKSSHKFV